MTPFGIDWELGRQSKRCSRSDSSTSPSNGLYLPWLRVGFSHPVRSFPLSTGFSRKPISTVLPWNLGHLVMVQDTGFNSADNRRILLRECGDYIIGEKLRVGTDGAAVEELSQSTGKAHTKAACALRSHPAYGRYIKQDERGVPRIDTAKIASESLLDGKFLVSTSSMKMDAADVVAGYKQLWAIERVFRDMKNILDIRPVYHAFEATSSSVGLPWCWCAMRSI